MIGKLRHRLKIQAAAPTEDPYGGRSDPWAKPVTVATVWGRIESLRGRERMHAMQLEDRVTHRVRIRYRDDVTAQQRLVIGSRVFNIRAVIDRDGRRRWLELLCEEGVAT